MVSNRRKFVGVLLSACSVAAILLFAQAPLPLAPWYLAAGSSSHDGALHDHIPSIRSGLAAAENDVSPDAVVRLSGEVDALGHVTSRDAKSTAHHARWTRNVSGCSSAAEVAFLGAYQSVLSANAKHLASVTDAPPDEWTGPAPICGIYKLYNRTAELLVVRSFDHRWLAGQRRVVRVQRCSRANEASRSSSACSDVYVVSQLRGVSIVAATVEVLPQDNCDFLLTFDVVDPGTYRLEIQVVWWNGLGPEQNPRVPPTVLRKTHSKFGKKSHQKYVFNEVCESHTHVIGSPATVEVVAATERHGAAPKMLPRCEFHHAVGVGRWRHHRNDVVCNESTEYCEGDPKLLNDAKPFNEDYLWAPRHCKFRYFALNSGPTSSCIAKKGTMLLMGDSTTREYAQNLRLFDLRNTNIAKYEYANWKLDWQYFSRSMAEKSVARLGKELAGSQPAILVANLGPLHLIGGLKTDDWKFYVDQWEKLFRSGALAFIEKKVFLGPAAIHYATNDMTAQRMLNWMDYAYRKLSPLGFEYLPAWNITVGRPEASWDGVHYSAERGKAQMRKLQRKRQVFKWNGGVSVMLTTVLLNLLCP